MQKELFREAKFYQVHGLIDLLEKKVLFGSIVKLNVGGYIYQTSLVTLRKDPDSKLCAMFSGSHELKPEEEEGAYFIDRDGKLFG